MRPKPLLRQSRPVKLTVSALMLVLPGSAVALAAGSTAAPRPLQIHLSAQRITYGQAVVATGVAPRAAGGRKLVLELAPAGRAWKVIGSTLVHSNGRFRIAARPQVSGAVRVLDASGTAVLKADANRTANPPTGPIAPSASRRVAVAATLVAPAGAIVGLSGQTVEWYGTLLPRAAGRVVTLEGDSGTGWRALGRARTRANGHFTLRYAASTTGQRTIRLSFSGDRFNGAARTHSRRLTVYRQSLASWYDDAGATACGFHAGLGVANKDLPCGTKVSFRYGGRSVTAVVDDRGPYAGGREWDFNQNTAAALGFNGVDSVWSSR